ncbi:uncharacterized protein F5Z01DRAFT_688976 [Emericellopsis atlantica]|uniref:Uncharacterized protein n=1 Tax=Emericellopsis atlantica TaxID=2614577 RepID=A0A9P7ZJN8_9HYPO|nr:uncharacterized protein F5Z01DRAFT_688976 [Emericellopsis atlantica]KAG9252917.1 hypothetical protein F5Z01DRAFT_688976 [Emericellopsis atlantica]
MTRDHPASSQLTSVPKLRGSSNKTRQYLLERLLTRSPEKRTKCTSWKPRSLSWPFFAILVLITLLIAGAIRHLAQRSQKHGGLAISASIEDIPKIAEWSQLYAPTVVAVLYGLIWSWFDLDSQRMQPWFELFKANGAGVAFGFFEHYPRNILALTPIKALRHGHWPVFISSLSTSLVMWAMVPLQSAIFSIQSRNQMTGILLNKQSKLAELPDQLSILNVDTRGRLRGNKITGETVRLSSEIFCSPAKVSRATFDRIINSTNVGKSAHFILNDKGCNATVYPRSSILGQTAGLQGQTSEYDMFYWGSYSSDNFHSLEPTDGGWRWDLASLECPDVKHQFVAAWDRQKKSDDPSITLEHDLSAIWCATSYWKQQVRATVSADKFQLLLDNIVELKPRERLSPKELNSSAYETFFRGDTIAKATPDWTITNFQNHDGWILDLIHQRLSRIIQGPAEYALAVDHLDIEQYSDVDVLTNAYSQAWKRHFALTASQLFRNMSAETEAVIAIEQRRAAIVVSRPLALTVESLLFLVALLTVALAWLCYASPSHLRLNPCSISRISRIVSKSPDVRSLFNSTGTLRTKELIESFQVKRFALRRNDYRGKNRNFAPRGESGREPACLRLGAKVAISLRACATYTFAPKGESSYKPTCLCLGAKVAVSLRAYATYTFAPRGAKVAISLYAYITYTFAPRGKSSRAKVAISLRAYATYTFAPRGKNSRVKVAISLRAYATYIFAPRGKKGLFTRR